MLRKNFDDLREAGDWYFDSSYEHITIAYPSTNSFFPGKQYDVVSLPLTEGGWKWDKNKESPTLTPSILVRDRWHGFMRNGKLEEA
jgi:hypothetical protein